MFLSFYFHMVFFRKFKCHDGGAAKILRRPLASAPVLAPVLAQADAGMTYDESAPLPLRPAGRVRG
jgi:hypothetical protein